MESIERKKWAKSRPIFISFLGLLFSFSIGWFVTLAVADDVDVNVIIEKANTAAYYSADDGKSVVSMTIIDKQGRKRQREFVVLRKDKGDGGEQFFYVYFKKPSDVRKMVFLVHKNIDRDDDRWFYLPALDLVKRIAGSDKRTSFVGSHFFYEDVSGRSVNADIHELVETTDQYYVLKNTPKDKESVEFSSYTIWIDKTTYLPMKAEYYGEDDRKSRLVEVLEVKTIEGFPTVTKSRVQDLASGGETISEFKGIKYNIGLKEKIFTERYLRRPPREVR